MRIIFVGIHNKQNMTALDSKTMTGKVIDRIIVKIPTLCIKTNLCDIDYFPKNKRLLRLCNFEWNEKHRPDKDTIIVLLGGLVQKNFLLTEGKIINLAHPAGVFGTNNKEQYVVGAVEKIKNFFA